jgi:predicted transcriptional regulator of viral defense system
VLPTLRHQRIVDLVAQREYVTITEVQHATGASPATARRDLARLATSGAITRIRGGATRPPGPRGEARLLAACVARVGTALARRDLNAVEQALYQALDACERLRRFGGP